MGCYNSGEPRERVLKIYNWADYIGDSVLEDFQAYYKEQTGENIRIVYQTFDINEIMLTKIEKGHEDFDVVCPSEYIIAVSYTHLDVYKRQVESLSSRFVARLR